MSQTNQSLALFMENAMPARKTPSLLDRLLGKPAPEPDPVAILRQQTQSFKTLAERAKAENEAMLQAIELRVTQVTAEDEMTVRIQEKQSEQAQRALTAEKQMRAVLAEREHLARLDAYSTIGKEYGLTGEEVERAIRDAQMPRFRER